MEREGSVEQGEGVRCPRGLWLGEGQAEPFWSKRRRQPWLFTCFLQNKVWARGGGWRGKRDQEQELLKCRTYWLV